MFTVSVRNDEDWTRKFNNYDDAERYRKALIVMGFVPMIYADTKGVEAF
jgi:hypothetical protein